MTIPKHALLFTMALFALALPAWGQAPGAAQVSPGPGTATATQTAPGPVAVQAPAPSELPESPFVPLPPPVLTKIEFAPPQIHLTTAKDRQSFIVQATFADGLTRDVTAESTLALADGSKARQDGHALYPVADGATTLSVAFGGQSLTIPVNVARTAEQPPVSFRLDVMPTFMRAGCNTGSCHGSARGRDGFRLSLFGFDPAGDYNRITREQPGRRVNLALPTESTLLEKGIGAVPHTGGQKYTKDGELYQTVLNWIEAGTPNDDVTKLPTVVGVELYPNHAVLDGPGATQALTVLAKYSDGTDRDVTPLAVFLTNNDVSAAISPAGVITAGARGEAFVMARFDTFAVGSQVLVLPKDLDFEYPAEPEGNDIDKLVAAKLKKLRIAPSGLCSDEAFLRRVYLDVVGLIPTPDEFNRFMTSASPNKRAELVDELLTRKEFTEIWVSKWAEMLQIRSSNEISYKATLSYYNWLVEKISKNTPLDQMVRELLGASGGTFKAPATNFYQATRETLPLTENVAQVFLGMRIQCAQCHNHPFDRWTQDDYYGFAAFLSQVGRKQAEDYRELIIFNAGGGEVNHPVGGRVMKPKFLGAEVPDVAGKDRRVVLAEWLASPRNPWFATSFANRVWAHFLGIGIVEPVDDVRVSNPASNPELLAELGRRFTASNYDLRALVRDICNSRAYQRSTQRVESNAQDERNFAHANLRRIKSENLLDVISEVTETQDKFQGLPKGARAVQIADGTTSSYFLTTFGRATRETVCSCEVKMEPTLSQALHLLNGKTVNDKLKEGGVAKKLAEAKVRPPQAVAQLYVRTLTRQPTPEELQTILPALAAEPDPTRTLEDLFWALLNSREFLFNH